MPWCDACERFWNPNALNPDGSCRSCGTVIATSEDDTPEAPWHFKLLIGALVIYLGFRGVQLVGWVLERV